MEYDNITAPPQGLIQSMSYNANNIRRETTVVWRTHLQLYFQHVSLRKEIIKCGKIYLIVSKNTKVLRYQNGQFIKSDFYLRLHMPHTQ